MKPADRDRDAGCAELGRQIHRPRKLVRLHADQADEPGLGVLDAPDDPLDRDDRVALVIGVDFDRDIGAERAALGDIGGDAVKTGQRIRRDPGFPPLDHIAVIVVMRRLDQLDDKPAVPPRTLPAGISAGLPCGMLAKKADELLAAQKGGGGRCSKALPGPRSRPPARASICAMAATGRPCCCCTATR